MNDILEIVARGESETLEFFKPGALPDGVTIESILSGANPSRPRNRLIASIFREAGIIEKYGSGIKRVRSVLSDAGASAPIFESSAGFFKVTLFPVGAEVEGGQKGGQKALGGSRENILALMVERPQITRRELSDRLEIAESAVEKHIAVLKKTGLIKRVGGRKSGHWDVTRSGA